MAGGSKNPVDAPTTKARKGMKREVVEQKSLRESEEEGGAQ